MIDPRRAFLVTAALVVIGVVVGAGCGLAAIALMLLLGGGGPSGGMFAAAAGFGAVLGAITAPAFSWLLLRHVPLGKAIVHTAIGTVIGGVLGFALPVIPVGGAVIPGLLYGPIAGFLVAAVRLRLKAQRSLAAARHQSQIGGGER